LWFKGNHTTKTYASKIVRKIWFIKSIFSIHVIKTYHKTAFDEILFKFLLVTCILLTKEILSRDHLHMLWPWRLWGRLISLGPRLNFLAMQLLADTNYLNHVVASWFLKFVSTSQDSHEIMLCQGQIIKNIHMLIFP